MNVVIRTDASLEIGTGHVMRCTTLAKQLEREGANITFICRNFPGNSNLFLQNQGFNVYTLILPNIQNHWKWIRENWKQDAEETKSAITSLNRKVDLLIIDHYGLDIKWESVMRAEVDHIMVIDDLSDRTHDCDLLLDQNYYLNMENRYNGLLPESCIQLLGPNYVLLRDEFLLIDPSKIKRDGNVKNVLVFFGGTDPTGETIKTIQAIQELNCSKIEFNIVVGAANPQREKIEYICNESSNIIFHCQVSNMAELMMNADFSIGAGGSTTWERCFLQLPSITIIVAENQRDIAHAVARKGAAICLGESSHITNHHIQEEFLKILHSSEKNVEMSTKCSLIMNPQIVKRNETVERIKGFLYKN
ncbi:UDP-2,4-diacetamido-2,4,6-trideoxy-beta-L-altropyranose hydrolase [Niallia oryzisoli]|uniref:UDP-2,4-diacetamido-2,4, 6-trideoxy-beta-L-altropyranose hydrolase n=1 Tax=Niallia oryzisoli TaxID=1737571 RepID=UPI0037364C79